MEQRTRQSEETGKTISAETVMFTGLVLFGALYLLYSWVLALGVLTLATGYSVIIKRREDIARATRATENLQYSLARQIGADQQAVSMIANRYPDLFHPVERSDMDATSLLRMLAIMDEVSPSCIVELGCGLSTVAGAHWIRDNKPDARWISYDTDGERCQPCASSLNRLGLSGFADVRKVKSEHNPASQQMWYDLDDSLEGVGAIDLLVVRGPGRGDTRLPALPYFWNMLTEDAVVILDHSGLRDKCIRRWCAEHPGLKATWMDSVNGAWVIRRNANSVTALP